MKQEDFENYLRKRVKLFLKNGRFYTGRIIRLKDDSLEFQDKFGLMVSIEFSEICAVQEEADYASH